MEYKHPDIGKILITKRASQKKVALRYLPFKTLECSAPKRMSDKQIISFAQENISWIKNQEKKYYDKFLQFIEKGTMAMVYHYVDFSIGSENFQIEYQDERNTFLLHIPHFHPLKNPDAFDIFISNLEEIMKSEAKMVLPPRIKMLAKKYGYRYERLFIKNVNTRWGSCSSVNNINLNAHLVRLPNHLIDYVLLHELVHTVHKNHGKDFWRELDNCMQGKAFQYDRELKAYNTSIFL